MKPLAKAYLEENESANGKAFRVYSGGLTQKGFLLLDCKEFAVLMPGGTEVAQILLDDILPKLNGKKANKLVAILNRANRFGADLGTDDSDKLYYVYNEEEETFFTSIEKPSKEETSTKKLSLDDFGITTESNTESKSK